SQPLVTGSVSRSLPVGHGQSEGERMVVSDFQVFIRDVLQHVDVVQKDHPGLPIFLLGHSMGGAITILTAAERPGHFSGMVLISPLVLANPESATTFKGWGPATVCQSSWVSAPKLSSGDVPWGPVESGSLGPLWWHRPDLACWSYDEGGVSPPGGPAGVAPLLSWTRGSLHAPAGLSEEFGTLTQNGIKICNILHSTSFLGEPLPLTPRLPVDTGAGLLRWMALGEVMSGSSSNLDKLMFRAWGLLGPLGSPCFLTT
ncbi:hypothetical protein E2I00_011820, partial [Balaenoptera physalus]